jgi:hypothetical protein
LLSLYLLVQCGMVSLECAFCWPRIEAHWCIVVKNMEWRGQCLYYPWLFAWLIGIRILVQAHVIGQGIVNALAEILVRPSLTRAFSISCRSLLIVAIILATCCWALLITTSGGGSIIGLK